MPFADYDFSEVHVAAEADDGMIATFTGVARRIDEPDSNRRFIESFAPIPLKANGEPDVLLLRDHDRTQVIGGFKSIVQDGARLVCEGALCLAVEKARETHELMKRKYLNGLSVGWTAEDDDIRFDEKKRLVMFRNAKLGEISVVARQAQTSARVHRVNASDMVTLLAKSLDQDEMAILLDEGFEALVARQREKLRVPKPPKPPAPFSRHLAEMLAELKGLTQQ